MHPTNQLPANTVKDPVAPILEGGYQQVFPGYVSIDPRENALESFWRILQKRKWAVIASTVVFATLSLILSARTKPLYRASCLISISKPSSDTLGLKDPTISEDYYDYAMEIETQTKVLQSDALALEVIRDLALDKNPAFMGPSRSRGDSSSQKSAVPEAIATPDTERQTALLGMFAGGLNVTIVPRTRVVQISYVSRDPKLATTIANGVATAFIEQNIRTKYESTVQTSDWISQQLSDLRLKTETAQEKLVRYQKDHGILGIDDKQNIITSKLDELNRQLTAAEAERIQKEASYRMATSGDPDILARTGASPVMERLQTDRGALQVKYAQLTTTFGSSYPAVVEVKNQLEDLDKQVRAEMKRIEGRLKGEYLTSLQREKMLRAALENQKQEANTLNESAIEYNVLKRDLETSRQLYENLLQRLKEASVSAGLRSNNIRIIDPARIPTAPFSPDLRRNFLLGVLLGVFGGIVLAFIQDAMDNTVRTPEQVQLISGLPSLGVVPLEGSKRSSLRSKSESLLKAKDAAEAAPEDVLMIVHRDPFSQTAESYRALRTSILLSSLGAPPKVILVTSALPQEGKTTTAINCATALAQQGSRVLLIDADLRRPRIASSFKIESSLGLSNLLTGSAKLKDVVLPTAEVPNLSVIISGPVPPQPAELLGSNLMDEMLSTLREQFDHVVIDSPPALSVTDSVILSARVDSVLMVVYAGKTRKEALRRVSQVFAQVNARVMGVVMNGVDLQSPDHYYNYYGKRYGDAGYYRERQASSSGASKSAS